MSQTNNPSPSALSATQKQVDDVTNIMRTNLEKVIERDAKMSELQARSEAMQMGANQFQMQSTNLKRKMWWQSFKMWIIVSIVFLILMVIIMASSMKAKNNYDEAHDVANQNVHNRKDVIYHDDSVDAEKMQKNSIDVW